MDLSERSTEPATRHPWELARAHALRSILARAGGSIGRLLDVGCGDGYAGLFVLGLWSTAGGGVVVGGGGGDDGLVGRAGAVGGAIYVGYDRELTDEQCRAWSDRARGIAFVNVAPSAGETFDTVLACDVIEHVADDVELVRWAWSRLVPRGRMLVTVPAFQALFSHHDLALRHHRRYSLSGLRATLDEAESPAQSSGYLFGSLLFPRLASCAAEGLRRAAGKPPVGYGRPRGVGDWRLPAWSSQLIAGLLRAENRALVGLASVGVTLPGLSVWALSVKPAAVVP